MCLQRNPNAAVDIYKQALPRPKGQSNYQSSAAPSGNALVNKLKPRKNNDSASKFYLCIKFSSLERKFPNANSLQRESNNNSELGFLVSGGNPPSSQQNV